MQSSDTPAQDWDRHEILAQVRRRGLTLSKLSRRAGWQPNTLNAALERPWPKGEKIIADALGLTVEDIWPSRVERRRQRAAA
jgi:Ner family transcriptional regulator